MLRFPVPNFILKQIFVNLCVNSSVPFVVKILTAEHVKDTKIVAKQNNISTRFSLKPFLVSPAILVFLKFLGLFTKLLCSLKEGV
jgi:hypothetical protein